MLIYSFFQDQPKNRTTHKEHPFINITIVDIIIYSALQYQLLIVNCMNHPNVICIVQCLAFQHMERFGDFITLWPQCMYLVTLITYVQVNLDYRLYVIKDCKRLVFCTTSCERQIVMNYMKCFRLFPLRNIIQG